MNIPFIHPSIQTYSGNKFDFTEFGNVVLIDDISHALSNICRFGGHCRQFYSVAQHSILASYIVPTQDALWALLHDAAEAYVGDIPTPLKQLIPDYKKIEKRVEGEVLELFGLRGHMPASVKHADLVMLATERRDLMAEQQERWEILDNIIPLKETIVPLLPFEAKQAFLIRFSEIVLGMRGDRIVPGAGRTS